MTAPWLQNLSPPGPPASQTVRSIDPDSDEGRAIAKMPEVEAQAARNVRPSEVTDEQLLAELDESEWRSTGEVAEVLGLKPVYTSRRLRRLKAFRRVKASSKNGKGKVWRLAGPPEETATPPPPHQPRPYRRKQKPAPSPPPSEAVANDDQEHKPVSKPPRPDSDFLEQLSTEWRCAREIRNALGVAPVTLRKRMRPFVEQGLVERRQHARTVPAEFRLVPPKPETTQVAADFDAVAETAEPSPPTPEPSASTITVEPRPDAPGPGDAIKVVPLAANHHVRVTLGELQLTYEGPAEAFATVLRALGAP